MAIWQLRLDGTVDVMLPDSTPANLPLERLTRLYDGLEQLEDMWSDDVSDAGSSYATDGDQEEIWTLNDNGVWEQGDDDNEDDWSTDEEAADVEMEGWSSSDPTTLPPTNGSPVFDMEVDEPTSNAVGAQPIQQELQADHSQEMAPSVSRISEEDKEKHWKRFEVLPSTPIDHAFYTSIPAQPSRNFLARLSKEYRVLSSSLPGTCRQSSIRISLTSSSCLDTVLVRAYEDRTDLLRCLIIGPENTPYEDAPFVIDWMLDSNFPQSPPIAHFHSWTNGNGRGQYFLFCSRCGVD